MKEGQSALLLLAHSSPTVSEIIMKADLGCRKVNATKFQKQKKLT